MISSSVYPYLIGSPVLALILSFMLKTLFPSFRRPNGQRFGIVNYHIVFAVSLITTVAYFCNDYVYTLILSILSYLLIRSQIESRQHYVYQIVLSIVVGCIPIFSYIMWKYKYKSTTQSEMYLTPLNDEDNRNDAFDYAPELNLDTFEKDDTQSIQTIPSISSHSES